MKKGATLAAAKDQPPPTQEPTEPEVPQSGHGTFEYKDTTLYVGQWKLVNGNKLKHGHGKIVYPGGRNNRGEEQYEGDWHEDKMQGHGRYQFTSGAVYIGDWAKGKMEGKGTMENTDGTGYKGDWLNGLMHGEGCYTDLDKVKWEGIFINGSYDSKI